MVLITAFAIGFVLYNILNLLTADFINKINTTIKKKYIIIFSYIYYSILAIYFLKILFTNRTTGEIFVGSFLYLLFSSLILLNYYNQKIKKKDEENFGRYL